MKVLTVRTAVDFLNAPPPVGLGMHVTHAWVRKMAEPDADGRRRLPFFKEGTRKRGALKTTDDALRAHYRESALAALAAVHGKTVELGAISPRQLRDTHGELEKHNSAIWKSAIAGEPSPTVAFSMVGPGDAIEAPEKLGTRPAKRSKDAVSTLRGHRRKITRRVRCGKRHTFSLDQEYGVCHTQPQSQPEEEPMLSQMKLSAAKAYDALQASYDDVGADVSADFMGRLLVAPILTAADAAAKAKLIADLSKDIEGGNEIGMLARQLLVWAGSGAKPLLVA